VNLWSSSDPLMMRPECERRCKSSPGARPAGQGRDTAGCYIYIFPGLEAVMKRGLDDVVASFVPRKDLEHSQE
ncbi:MAG TPA: hypothetical protein VJ731_12345, partial [Terriglobales bacterium]|nr:hypothetical protein [Terriglobales bacterium]